METAQPLSSPDHWRFASTHWTAIGLCAGNDDVAHAARESLCRAYWYPIYAYIKRCGNDHHHAEDLTQDFFDYILRRPWFVRADQTRGRFRTFLLTSIDNFLKEQFGRKQARKREGRYQHIPYNLSGMETGYANDAGSNPTQRYEVEWASAIVAATLKQLEAEYADAGKGQHYPRLKRYLTIPGDATLYDETATELNISLSNAKVAVHRLRVRYGEVLRERVAQTVAAPEDIQDEVRYLRAVLAAS